MDLASRRSRLGSPIDSKLSPCLTPPFCKIQHFVNSLFYLATTFEIIMPFRKVAECTTGRSYDFIALTV